MNYFDKETLSRIKLPLVSDFSPKALRSWFDNIDIELRLGFLEESECAYLRDYYDEAGLLRPWRRPYFDRHFSDSIAAASRHLLSSGKAAPRILDLGCGTGSQSLFFAFHGARVIANDMDAKALAILAKRKEFYEKLCGRELDIVIVEKNAIEVEYKQYGLLDGVYSLFAFNMIQPSSKMIDVLYPMLSPRARWAILDGNQQSLWARLLPRFKRNAWSPRDMRYELEIRDFSCITQQGGVAIPPFFWSFLSYKALNMVDRVLCSSLLFPISCQTLAMRTGAVAKMPN